jgi:hypothetical protein
MSHCHTYNEVGNMRVDRDGERGIARSGHSAEAKERPWMDWERR